MKIRILVAVAPDGRFECVGWSGGTEEDLRDSILLESDQIRWYWVEAEVEPPETTVVPGRVG